jgi:hypothetical protein
MSIWTVCFILNLIFGGLNYSALQTQLQQIQNR